jgi:hypothetical protein
VTEPDPRRLSGFVGEQPFAHHPPVLGDGPAIVPAPQRWHVDGVFHLTPAQVTVTGAPPGPLRLLTEGLGRAGVDTGDAGWPVRFALDAAVSGGDEAYAIDARSEGMSIRAAALAGLARGAATARQLIGSEAGRLTVITGTVEDWPVVPIRLLAGWGLYRDHHLEWALEVAAEAKYNRVLYNWWTATPSERLGPREGRLVEDARAVGVELVCELRRQALGPRFSFADPQGVDALLRHYDDAVEQGFRSFGFLFDDTDVDSFDEEHGMLTDVVAHLTQRIGEEPEFFFCPRFYWFPGQMDYSWMAAVAGPDDGGAPSMAPMLGGGSTRSLDEAIARQEEYQRRLSAALPDRTEVYLANWWSGTPDDWEAQLDEGWTSRVGRAPVFWDNQQQNDYRAALVLPMPLHQRPPGFAGALRGYCLNSGVPLSAFAPASVTAGAWAWNPEAYEPGAAFGAAVVRFFGPAAAAVTNALAEWGDLFDELLQPRTGMEQHYRGLHLAVKEGRAATITARLDAVAANLATAHALLAAEAHSLAVDALLELGREVERVRLDLALASATDRVDGEALVTGIRQVLAERLPPVPELEPVIAGTHDLVEPVPGISWAIHFLYGPLRAGPLRMLGKLS